ncbi:MAG: T9SS type A sorting domain-containing protein [Saprospiraceae bacterium]|nr:T9SS type A sorting domain-containing protein [Saprospiraceae bacterium]
MKNIITSAMFCLSLTLVFGQITITNTYFPSAGDSLITANATAQTLRSVYLTKASATAQNWDYSFLRARTTTTRTVRHYRGLNPIADSAILKEFPTATTAITDSAGQIAVYKTSTTRFDLLGFFNANLGVLPVGLRPKFNPPSLERRAPLVFNSTNNNQTGFSLPFSAEIIPDTFLAQLPIRPDSLRIRFTTTRQDKVDAWGKIRIPGSGDLDCLRERRYEITDTRIDAKIGGIPIWVDITNFIPASNFRPRDTSLIFHFWSNLYKEPLLTIRADNDSTPNSAEYKWFSINTPSVEITSQAQVTVFPTPAKEAVSILLEGLAESAYTVQIYNALGHLVFYQKIKHNTTTQILNIITHQWQSGSYFLILRSESSNQDLVQKAFIIGR